MGKYHFYIASLLNRIKIGFGNRTVFREKRDAAGAFFVGSQGLRGHEPGKTKYF